MFYLFFFLFFFNAIYANTVTILDKFSNTNHICIYNNTNDSLKIKLKDQDDSNDNICIYFKDYSGILASKCDTGEVEVDPDSLRTKVIYYIVDLTANENNDDYNLTIDADDDGMRASECPTNNLAKVSNTTPSGIANAMIIAGVLAGFLFFAGIIFALTPHIREEEKDEW